MYIVPTPPLLSSQPEFDVRGAVEVFRNNPIWGQYARTLLDNNKFQQPRNGRNDDNAHPPITPVKSANPSEIPDVAQRKGESRNGEKLYEHVRALSQS